MGRVCVHLKNKGIDVVLMTEDEYNDLKDNEQIMNNINDIAIKYIEVICSEIEKMKITEKQKLMAELLIVNRLHNGMEYSLDKLYEEGLLKKAE